MKYPVGKLPFTHRPTSRIILDADGKVVADVDDREDAPYIIQACNDYPKAIELLEQVGAYVHEVLKGRISEAEAINYIQELNIEKFLRGE